MRVYTVNRYASAWLHCLCVCLLWHNFQLFWLYIPAFFKLRKSRVRFEFWLNEKLLAIVRLQRYHKLNCIITRFVCHTPKFTIYKLLITFHIICICAVAAALISNARLRNGNNRKCIWFHHVDRVVVSIAILEFVNNISNWCNVVDMLGSIPQKTV